MQTTIPKKELNKLLWTKNALISIIVFLVIVIFFFALNIINAEKINQGTKIANISIGGLSTEEAENILNSESQKLLKNKLFLSYKESYWEVTPEKLGIEINIPTTVNIAFNKGHEKNKLFANSWWQLASLFGHRTELIWEINEKKLDKFLQENLGSIHQPAQNTTLIYNKENDTFSVTNSKKGVVVNKEKLKKDLEENINNFKSNDIVIVLEEDFPEVLATETEKAHKEIKALLEKTPFKIVVINNGEKTEIDTIDKETLLELIDFGPTIDPENPENKILGTKFSREKIKDYLIALSPLINQKPINAQLTIEDGRVVAFALSEDGLELEIENNIPTLAKEILEQEKEIELKIIKVEPEITTESINNLGITALLAKGVSNFSGSPNSRIHNIKIGTAKFNGVLIGPNEEFSFNKILGEVGPEQGYKPELVIKKNKTIPEYGGGLCQVSTTMFRAAINAGFEITQRYPHAFPVKYYNPQGFDATIYPPFPDLRFINNTPNYILVQTQIDEYELIFEVYGTNDDRKIEVGGPYQYEIKEDGSMKARLIQKVFDKDNNIIIDEIFYSNYKSPNLYPVEKNPLE